MADLYTRSEDIFVIPSSNPGARYRRHRMSIDRAVANVLEKGHYILSEEVERFESSFSDYVGCSFGVGVANGTDALELALRALNIGAGDEVITVSHTAVATVAAIENSGATPSLVDIVPESFTIDPARIEEAITSRTKAIVVVHLYGQPADMDAILPIARKFELRIIEDCAQAHGARIGERRVGSLGDVGTFSFYPTKNLGAFGDGGIVVCSDQRIADRVRELREYGWRERYVSASRGFNSRLDEIQAAILSEQLPCLEADNEVRRKIALRYNDGLAGNEIILPVQRVDTEHVYHQYVIRSVDRDSLREFLKSNHVGTAIHYPLPVHKQPAYAGRIPVGLLTETDRIAGEILSLPIYPELDNSSVSQVIEAVRRFRIDSK